jgi:saccharopine dehydrogenase-like NADP-dependent oxidoreductase
MKKLHAPAQDADILFLNEIGLDPGIDHMSAMKLIHQLQDTGDTIDSFTSYCGVLPAPESNTNPLGYKFSWSPRGVLLASRNSARYLWNGREVTIPGEHLFQGYTYRFIPGFGYLEGYPNRDSVRYRDLYNLSGIQTLQRGTLRYMGWCELMKKVGEMGLLSLKEIPIDQEMTFRHYISNLTGLPEKTVESYLAEYLHLDSSAAVMRKLEWLGLFSNTPVPCTAVTPLDVLMERMIEKLQYGPGERDMAVLHHEFISKSTKCKHCVTSTFIGYGKPHGDSAVARTVALPAAIGTRLLLQEKISLRGVRIPIYPEIYTPVLQELESHGIMFKEKTQKMSS